MEEFKIISGFEGYRVSNYGRLQSRLNKGRSKARFKDAWHDYKLKLDGHGYLCASLCDGLNKPKTLKIHNLVLLEFVGPKKSGFCVRHIDGNKLNNALSNLVYGTYKENEADKILHGTWDTRLTGRKLTPIQIDEIRSKIKSGLKDIQLSVEYNVSRPTITRIRNGKIWK